MRVLIGCEESGVVRRAFAAKGHDAWSCDILQARDGSDHHYQMDIVERLEHSGLGYWDLIILHPDCTKVAVCGNKTWAGTPEREAQKKWIDDLVWLANRRGQRLAVENPASVIWPMLRRREMDVQFVQPWEHGHPEQKKTGLGLYNLPRLVASNNVYDKMMALTPQERERVFRMPPGPDRKRDRSETYAGIAAAMADQWGSLASLQQAAE